MAVLSPGIVVALVTLFLINRFGQTVLAFEHIFTLTLFGLSGAWSISIFLFAILFDLAAVASAGASTSSTGDAGGAGKKGKKSKSSDAGHGKGKAARLSPASLPVVVNGVSPQMFAGETELPKNTEFDYLLGMTVSFFISHLFEETAMCLLPNLSSKFSMSQTHWFGALVFFVGVYELMDMARSMASGATVAMLTCVGTVGALALIANGDNASFFLLDTAFDTLRAWCEYIHVQKLSLAEELAPHYAQRMTMVARIVAGVLAGLLFASTAVPARRFAGLDFDLYQRYRRDEEEDREDAYALPKPTSWVVLAIALDYFLPLVALVAMLNSRTDDDASRPFAAYGMLLLLACIALRIGLTRVRMQTYLDGAVDHFRAFWVERKVKAAPGASAELGAASRLRVRVVSTYYYLPTLGSLYVFNPMVALMLVVLCKRSGGMTFGLCAVADPGDEMTLSVAAREVFGFLAWVALASYSLFSLLSIAVDSLFDALEPAGKASDGFASKDLSSSERRRLRRKHKAA